MAKKSSSLQPQSTDTPTVKVAFGTGATDGQVATGAVNTTHPQWDDHIDEWTLMRETARGTKAIKDKTTTYLPMPAGFAAQKDKGVAMYAAYQQRAQFPEIVSPTLMGMVGIIHRMEAKIDMPDAMMPLWESATYDGIPLEVLHKRITFEVLTTGRYALLVDAASAAEGGSDLPWIVEYTAEALINWSKWRDFFVLDEGHLRRIGYAWVWTNQWRVLQLNDAGQYTQTVYSGIMQAPDEAQEVVPTALGNKPLDEIPLVIIGPKDLMTDVDDPPLIGVAHSAVAIYQLSADYRHQLYMSGQETLFVFNMDPPDAIGAGVVVHSKAASKDQQTPDAKYVGPQGIGIGAHKTAIEDERASAAAAGARLFEPSTSSQESGDARRIRYAAETATLTSIAQCSAQGLERALKFIAIMMGLNPDDVVVTPNLSFVDNKLDARTITALVTSWQAGAFSFETLYDNLQRGEITSSERDADEEKDLILQDKADEINNPALQGLIDPVTGLPVKPSVTAPGSTPVLDENGDPIPPAEGLDPQTGRPIQPTKTPRFPSPAGA